MRALLAVPGPLVERVLTERPQGGGNPAVTVTPAGLAMIESVAREGGTMGLVASRLGVGRTTLKKLMMDDSPERLAFERGQAELEHEVGALLLAQARKGNTIAAIFFAKARLNWSDKGDAPTGPTTNVQIVLPRPLTEAEYEQRVSADTHSITVSVPGTEQQEDER